MENISKILDLAKNRISYFSQSKDDPVSVTHTSNTYFDEVAKELTEAREEYRDNNHVYLEDELGDVFWDYCCLLFALEKEWKISSIEAVFQRGYKKFSERIKPNGQTNGVWNEIKSMQKARNKAEHDQFYQ